jgi:hypothetical protein
MAKTPTKKTVGAARVDDIIAKYKDFPGIKVLERRLAHPELPGSLPIRLKDEPTFVEDPAGKKRVWYLRWINGGLEGRTSQVLDGLGYVPVRVDEMQNEQMLGGAQKGDDGYVRRGDKGTEWLAKMPLELYTEIKRKQQESRERRNRNAKLVKQDLANAAGAADGFGSEAGDMIHDDFTVEVTRSKSTYADELIDKG